MSTPDRNAWVCRHCGGPVMQRFATAWIHDRVRARGTPVCPRMADPVLRWEYEASAAPAPAAPGERAPA